MANSRKAEVGTTTKTIVKNHNKESTYIDVRSLTTSPSIAAFSLDGYLTDGVECGPVHSRTMIRSS